MRNVPRTSSSVIAGEKLLASKGSSDFLRPPQVVSILLCNVPSTSECPPYPAHSEAILQCRGRSIQRAGAFRILSTISYSRRKGHYSSWKLLLCLPRARIAQMHGSCLQRPWFWSMSPTRQKETESQFFLPRRLLSRACQNFSSPQWERIPW